MRFLELEPLILLHSSKSEFLETRNSESESFKCNRHHQDWGNEWSFVWLVSSVSLILMELQCAESKDK